MSEILRGFIVIRRQRVDAWESVAGMFDTAEVNRLREDAEDVRNSMEVPRDWDVVEVSLVSAPAPVEARPDALASECWCEVNRQFHPCPLSGKAAPVESAPPVDPTQWWCRKCATANHALRGTCRDCGTTRYSDPPVESAPGACLDCGEPMREHPMTTTDGDRSWVVCAGRASPPAEPGTDWNAEYEREAEAFRASTGYLAPGKDVPAAAPYTTRSEQIEGRIKILLPMVDEALTLVGLEAGKEERIGPWTCHYDAMSNALGILRAALALPPDPPGECCRRAAENGIAIGYEVGLAHGTAAGRREGFWLGAGAAAEIVDKARGEGHVDFRTLRDRIRALPLPGAKEGA